MKSFLVGAFASLLSAAAVVSAQDGVPPFSGCNATDYYASLLARKPNVDDWTRVADYRGPFHYINGRGKDGTDYPARYEKQLQMRSRFPFL